MLPAAKFFQICLTIVLAGQFLLVTNSFAAAPLGNGTSETASYFRLIWGLLVVLGIILIIYGFVRKRFSMFSTSSSQEIKIVEIRPMMGKKALCLVDVKGQEYLLGISGDNINHIATLPPESKSSFAKSLETAEGTS